MTRAVLPIASLLLGLAGCGEAPVVVTASVPEAEPEGSCPADPKLGEAPLDYPTGLHVVDHHLEDAQGNPITLRGVNRSGTEYRCIQGYGFFDGPSDTWPGRGTLTARAGPPEARRAARRIRSSPATVRAPRTANTRKPFTTTSALWRRSRPPGERASLSAPRDWTPVRRELGKLSSQRR